MPSWRGDHVTGFVPFLLAGSCCPPWGRDGRDPYGLSLEPGAGLGEEKGLPLGLLSGIGISMAQA